MLLISKTTHCGFTLLEMLLSAAIFTMMSLMMYQVLMIVTKSSIAINKKYKQISEMESLINKLDRDMSHITIHQKSSSNHNDYLNIRNNLLERDEFGVYLLCEENDSEKILLHYQPNTLAYSLKNKKSEKISANNSEDLSISGREVSTIFNSIVGFRIRIYHEDKWVSEWNNRSILPWAVEVTMEFEGIGTIRRVIILLNSQTEILS
ncbi:type II secretion system minor pseudopilin GspJ [Yersinia sp. Marseille-Q3913]|uniref:type II secretion system minor pseudopilin GspJ n=1 Tax=Yersinia sp. Marseille-Q3913 TaxID=2830769 RepID=UPI001BB063E1|nr:type II secretion system minor pseudopilin GspJ [Yersinia sp. Marseille-Q3913]